MKRRCPHCGDKSPAPILYGMPAFGPELEQKIADHKIVLGGCVLIEGAPEYYCFHCKKEFGSPAILISKHGVEKYEDIITSIRFRYGSIQIGYKVVELKKAGDSFSLDVFSYLTNFREFHRELKQDEWKQTISTLYDKLYLHEWKKRYVDPCVMDGDEGELEIKLTDRRIRTYSGLNAYPALWDELKAVFRPFFTEAGIKF